MSVYVWSEEANGRYRIYSQEETGRCRHRWENIIEILDEIASDIVESIHCLRSRAVVGSCDRDNELLCSRKRWDTACHSG
jgi:hypothetical protein